MVAPQHTFQLHFCIPSCGLQEDPVLRIIVLLILALGASATAAHAQGRSIATLNGDTIYEMRVPDGTTHIGRIRAQQADTITFETLAGLQIRIQRALVRLRPAYGRLVEGQFYREDRNLTRLFFAPTGRVLEPGQGYAGLFFILPFVGFGVTDNLTIAGGLPLVGDLEEMAFWLAPKLRVVNSARVQGSIGVLALRLPVSEAECLNFDCSETDNSPGVFGIAYGLATLGDNDNAFHVGVGYAFGSDVESDGERFPIMIGGERRLSRGWKLITENWIIPGTTVAGSLGMRKLGENWTWDFGLMGVEGVYFPIISFSYSWGH